jgi:hypothetical protein
LGGCSTGHPAGANRVFAPEDGALRYRQIDNFSLTHRVMFDWPDEVLDHHHDDWSKDG